MASAVPSSVPPPAKAATRALGKQPRMGKFLRTLVTVTVLMHVPFFFGAAGGLATLGVPYAWWIAAAAWTIGVGFFFGRARAGMYDKRRPQWYVRVVDIPYFIHWCACMWTVLPSIAAVCIWPFVRLSRGQSLGVPLAFFTWTYLVGVAISFYGIVVRRRWFHVQELDVEVEGLDPKLDGFRIAQLSDLHIGTTTPRSWGERWARAANAKKPDLAVVTGDMLTSGTEFYDDVAGVISTLTAREGVFVSMGNHDYFGDGESFIARLRATGATVLRNEGRVIERDGAKLHLAAIDDTWTRRDDMKAALSGRTKGIPTVLLAHEPERFHEAARHGVELVLSGHTHGGQIAVPFLNRWLNLSRLTHHYTLGLYRKGRSVLHVHPGLGTTGPPIRIGIAPAVVVLTLRAA